MTSPLAGSLAKTVSVALWGLFLDAVLTRDIPQDSPDPADPLPPVPTPFGCKAIVERYSDYYRTNGLVDAKDSLILAASLEVTPEPAIASRSITSLS